MLKPVKVGRVVVIVASSSYEGGFDRFVSTFIIFSPKKYFFFLFSVVHSEGGWSIILVTY